MWAPALDAAFVAALCMLALAGFSTLYADGEWWRLGGLGVLAGIAVAWTGAAARLLAVLVLVGAVGVALLLSGIVFPDLASERVLPTVESVRALADGALRGWSGVLNVVPPVGRTGHLAAVPFAGGLVAALLSMSIARRTSRPGWAVAPSVALLIAGILLGTPEPPALLAQGLGTVAVALLWGAVQRRRRARAAGGRLSRRPLATVLTLGAATAAVVAALPYVPFTEDGRLVLREEIEPPFDPSEQASPLAGFRRYVTEEGRRERLFTVEGLPAGARIRLATMDDYDGLVFNVAGGPADIATAAGDLEASGLFRKAGEGLPVPGDGREARLKFELGALGGVWLPSAGWPAEVRFSGPRADDLTDGFYYNEATGTGAVRPALSAGDRVEMDVVLPRAVRLQDLVGRATEPVALPAPRNVPDEVPQFAADAVGGESDAVRRVLALAAALRQGFYSDGVQGQAPSRPGHGAGRLTEMLEADALVGDDEQYAAAMALMLRSLDIPARVVVGFRPARAGAGPVQITGADAAAWVETNVRGAGWVPVDPTPDENRRLSQESPEPEPRPRVQSQPIPPPPPQLPDDEVRVPARDAEQADSPEQAWWVRALLVGLTVVGGILLVLSPVLLVLGAKMLRRRRRRTRGAPADRISGGWRELLDLARDLGVRVPEYATRREQATAVPYRGAYSMAAAADAAVFGPEPGDDGAVDRYWADIRQARRDATSGLPWHRRLRVALNPTSLIAWRRRKPH